MFKKGVLIAVGSLFLLGACKTDSPKKSKKSPIIETIDGVETHKIKLTKEPHTVDGQKVDDVVFYYFDTESNVPIAMEVELKSGPAKGQMYRTTMSDYQEVEGLYFAFTTTESIGQQEIITISLDITHC